MTALSENAPLKFRLRPAPRIIITGKPEFIDAGGHWRYYWPCTLKGEQKIYDAGVALSDQMIEAAVQFRVRHDPSWSDKFEYIEQAKKYRFQKPGYLVQNHPEWTVGTEFELQVENRNRPHKLQHAEVKAVGLV